MMMLRNNQNTNNLLISNMKFEVVDNLKYLGVNVNNRIICIRKSMKELCVRTGVIIV